MQKLSQSAGKNVVGRYQIELEKAKREKEAKTRRVMHKKIQIVNVIGKREHINWHESDMHDLNVGVDMEWCGVYDGSDGGVLLLTVKHANQLATNQTLQIQNISARQSVDKEIGIYTHSVMAPPMWSHTTEKLKHKIPSLQTLNIVNYFAICGCANLRRVVVFFFFSWW